MDKKHEGNHKKGKILKKYTLMDYKDGKIEKDYKDGKIKNERFKRIMRIFEEFKRCSVKIIKCSIDGCGKTGVFIEFHEITITKHINKVKDDITYSPLEEGEWNDLFEDIHAISLSIPSELNETIESIRDKCYIFSDFFRRDVWDD